MKTEFQNVSDRLANLRVTQANAKERLAVAESTVDALCIQAHNAETVRGLALSDLVSIEAQIAHELNLVSTLLESAKDSL